MSKIKKYFKKIDRKISWVKMSTESDPKKRKLEVIEESNEG